MSYTRSAASRTCHPFCVISVIKHKYYLCVMRSKSWKDEPLRRKGEHTRWQPRLTGRNRAQNLSVSPWLSLFLRRLHVRTIRCKSRPCIRAVVSQGVGRTHKFRFKVSFRSMTPWGHRSGYLSVHHGEPKVKRPPISILIA